MDRYSVSAIGIDLQGSIWVGYTWEGVSKYNEGVWKNFYGDILEYGHKATAIEFDSLGNIWFARYGNGMGLVKYDGNTRTIYRNGWSARSLLIDSKNNIWMGTYQGELVKFDGENWESHGLPIESDMNGSISDIEEDLYGNIWITTNYGLFKFKDSKWEVYNTDNSGLPSNYVSDLAIDMNGILWIGTSEGLAKFDGENWEIYNSENTSLIENYISKIALDSKGNKWLGTMEGLLRYDGSNWDYFIYEDVKYYNQIYSLKIDKDDNIWISANDIAKLSFVQE